MIKKKEEKDPYASFWEKFEKVNYTPVKLTPTHGLKTQTPVPTPRFATIDIETQNWTEFICGEVYWLDSKGKEYSFETSSIEELLIQCFRIASVYKIKNFVAHYGGKFDFLFFMGFYIPHLSFDVENIIPRGSSVLSFDVKMVEHKSLKVDFKIPEDKITFRDSSGLLPFSLGSLTKSFNVETLKGEMDFLFVKDVYNETPYIEKILTDHRCVLFYSRKQIFSLKKAMLQKDKISRLRYWNLERFRPYKYRGKISYVKPYMVKRNKKGEIVYNDWFEELTFPIFTKKDLLTYLHHDCKSLYQCLDAFFNAPLIRLSKKKWTTASQSVEVFRMFLNRDLHSIPDDKNMFLEGDVDDFVRQAYFGGRTEIFKPVFDSEILGKDFLYYYDVNSLYPFVMKEHPYPDKFIKWTKGKRDFDRYEMGIWKCKVRVPQDMYIPPLPIKFNERLIFPVGEFEGYWTKYELLYAQSLGCEILSYEKGAIFEDAGFIFKEFIDTLYNMRLEAKEKNDNVTQMTMKLLMNSCYGRMGINKMRSKIIIDDGMFRNVKFIADIDTKYGTIRLSEKPDKSSDLFSNPSIACFVTSYARVYLHTQMRKVNEKSVYYCDSVTKDRRVWVKTNEMNSEQCFSFENLWRLAENITKRGEKEVGKLDFETLSWNPVTNKLEFKKIKEIIRHKTNKKIYEIRSKKGFTRVTEDHSLINEKNERIKPSEISELFSPKALAKEIFKEMKLFYEIEKTNVFRTNDEVNAIAISTILLSRGDDHYFEYDKDGYLFRITKGDSSLIDENLEIKEIIGYGDYVYDLSVEDNENFFDCMGLIGLHNTDSVFSDKPMETGKELGAMKLEYRCRSACFLLPKTYVNEDIIEEDGKTKPQKLTMKGFDYKNIRNAFTFFDFMDYLGGERDKIFASEKPKFATFKTALRQGKFVTMKNDPVLDRENHERKEREYLEKTGKKRKYVKNEYKLAVKKLMGYYTKREIINNGFDTVPLKVDFNLEVTDD